MKRFIVFFFALISLNSCITYNFYSTTAPTEVYGDAKVANTIAVLPAQETIVIKGKPVRYQPIEHNGIKGYLYSSKLRYVSKANKYAYTYAKAKRKTYTNTAAVAAPASSQSNYSAPARSTSTGGQVQVKGYYRKDGTYVRPHTRSAPKKKG